MVGALRGSPDTDGPGTGTDTRGRGSVQLESRAANLSRNLSRPNYKPMQSQQSTGLTQPNSSQPRTAQRKRGDWDALLSYALPLDHVSLDPV